MSLIVLFLLGGNALKPGELSADPPTISCVGIRWAVSGDANRNAGGTLSYRIKGEWKDALPLFRVDPAGAVPDMFAGSVFGLPPDTEVELRARLADPDGGKAEKVVKVRTRAVPQATRFARTMHVVPGDGGGSGTEANPWRGLGAIAAKPGDLVILHQGAYRGTWTVSVSGTADAPIVFRGDGAVLEGGSPIVSANSTSFVHFEQLTFRGGEFAFVAHGGSDLVVRRCTFEGSAHAVTGTREDKPIRNWYVADNVMTGPSTWPRSKGIEETEGVQLAGTGHVVCHNRIRGYADGISITPSAARGVDFHNNDISECTDDGIEMDYGESNVRCFDNRLTNVFHGISAQPVYGGPCYIVRNAMYNVEASPFKLHNGTSGLLILHNTSVKTGVALCVYSGEPVHNAIFRNNLLIGTGEQLADWTSGADRCDLDYNGWGEGSGTWKIGNVRKSRLQDVEPHGMQVGNAGFEIPADLKKAYEPRVLLPKKGTGPGVRLPNINDGGLELGAYPARKPPAYGPRAEK